MSSRVGLGSRVRTGPGNLVSIQVDGHGEMLQTESDHSLKTSRSGSSSFPFDEALCS